VGGGCGGPDCGARGVGSTEVSTKYDTDETLTVQLRTERTFSVYAIGRDEIFAEQDCMVSEIDEPAM